MSDTAFQIYQTGQTYKVRITRLGNLVQEAEGFSSRADAASWVAQAQRLDVVRGEQQEPKDTPHLRGI